MIVAVSLHKTHICVVKSLVKIAAVSWHSLRRFIKPAPGKNIQDGNSIPIVDLSKKKCEFVFTLDDLVQGDVWWSMFDVQRRLPSVKRALHLTVS